MSRDVNLILGDPFWSVQTAFSTPGKRAGGDTNVQEGDIHDGSVWFQSGTWFILAENTGGWARISRTGKGVIYGLRNVG